MRIGFSGTHSTGKTTLVKELEKYLPNYHLDINVSRWVHGLGFPLNQTTNDESQELNLIKRVAHLNSYDKLLADRTIADNIAYTLAGWERKSITDSSLEYQMHLYYQNIEKYDIIFYIPPEIELEVDEVRPEDVEYRAEIDKLIRKLLTDDKSLHRVKNLVPITGTLEQRIEKVLKAIENESSANNLATS